MTLEKKYNQVCLEYAEQFCKKQGLVFEGFVGNEHGGITMCSDMFFNFQDIVWDVNTEQPKELIIEWYYEVLEHNPKYINYSSYSKGLRFKDIEE